MPLNALFSVVCAHAHAVLIVDCVLSKIDLLDINISGTAGGPGGHDRTLAFIFWLCQNIGGNKFQRTGDSPKWVKSKRRREKKREERPKVGNNNDQLRIATPPRAAHAKPPGPIFFGPYLITIYYNG